MSRSIGLPHAGRYPRAQIGATGAAIVVTFAGDGGRQRIELPLALVGDADAELVSLELAARLRDLGYDVAVSASA